MPTLCGLDITLQLDSELWNDFVHDLGLTLLCPSFRLKLQRLSLHIQLKEGADLPVCDVSDYEALGPEFQGLEFPALRELSLRGFDRWEHLEELTNFRDPWNLHNCRYPHLRSLALYQFPLALELLEGLACPGLLEFRYYMDISVDQVLNGDFEKHFQTLASFLRSFDSLVEVEICDTVVGEWLAAGRDVRSNTFPVDVLFECHGQLEILRCPALFEWMTMRTPRFRGKYFARLRSRCPRLRQLLVYAHKPGFDLSNLLTNLPLRNLEILPLGGMRVPSDTSNTNGYVFHKTPSAELWKVRWAKTAS